MKKKISGKTELRMIISKLRRKTPVTEWLAKEIDYKPKHKTERLHWIGWLREYDGPGYYGRSNPNRSLRYIYEHIQCGPMLLWLIESSGAPSDIVWLAAKAASRFDRAASQCAAIRNFVPWSTVEAYLIDNQR